MRIAFVGCGFVADLYMTSLGLHSQLELAGVWDHDLERLGAFTRFYGVKAYASLDDLLADGAVQVVVNLTTPASHHAITRACLGAGKHVYTEKPLAMEMDQARDLVDLAEASGLYLSSAPCSLLGETAQTVWKSLRQGAVGVVRLVYAELNEGMLHRMAYRQWTSKSGAPWPYRNEFEVGCTLEHAGYYLTWLCAFFGPVRELMSFASLQVPDKVPGETIAAQAPDFSVACLQHDSGVVSRLTCSVVTPHDHVLRIVGDDGVLTAENCWHYRSPVRLRRWITIRRRTLLNPLRRRVRLLGRQLPRVPRTGAASMDFCRGLLDLGDAIEGGRAPRLSARFCLHINELVLAIQRPGPESGRHVPTTTFDPLEPMAWAAD